MFQLTEPGGPFLALEANSATSDLWLWSLKKKSKTDILESIFDNKAKSA